MRLFTRIHGGAANPPATGEPIEETAAESGIVELPPEPAGIAQPASPRMVRLPVANVSLVRRERRALLRERERRIRDLGGLLLEMYRRNQFREDLIIEHCAQAMGIENRIHELESILARAKSGGRAAPGPRCSCGAPILYGARFCFACGAVVSAGDAPPGAVDAESKGEA